MTATVIRLPNRGDRFSRPGAVETADRALRAELRRARIRIAQLEASLGEALRDNVMHFDRAREAELQLAELLAESNSPDAS